MSMERNFKKTQLISFHLTSQRGAFLFQLYIWGKEVEQHCDLHWPKVEQGTDNIWLPGPQPAPWKTTAFIFYDHISGKKCICADEEIWTTKFQHTPIFQCTPSPIGEEHVLRERLGKRLACGISHLLTWFSFLLRQQQRNLVDSLHRGRCSESSLIIVFHFSK